MIGNIDFGSFLVLLAISAVVSAILHYGFKYYVVSGTGSYISKVIVGWLGAREPGRRFWGTGGRA